MGVMRVLDATGDTVVAWAEDDTESVAAAAAMFLEQQGERKLAFARRAGAPAADAELIRHFDPTAEEIVWVRPVAGG